MATFSTRKKINFRDLKLSVERPEPLDSGTSQTMPARLTPSGPRGRDGLRSLPAASSRTFHAMNITLEPPDAMSSTAGASASDFQNAAREFEDVQELGSRTRVSVMKVRHRQTGKIMARKHILLDARSHEQKRILRELQSLSARSSPFIVSSYGAYLAGSGVYILMEFMDKGSFESIYKSTGPINIEVLGKLALAVLEGLKYLYQGHRTVHRDIQPANILLNSNGDIKICDLSISGEHSIVNTFVERAVYLSPEHIRGAAHSVSSDIWSLGITLLELAVGQSPFSCTSDDERTPPSERPTLTTIEVMDQIVYEPAPRLPEGLQLSGPNEEMTRFVNACLERETDKRMGIPELMEHPWMLYSKENGFDMKAWAAAL